MTTQEQLSPTNGIGKELVRFCVNQVLKNENPTCYDCAIRLIEGDSAGFAISYECPYNSAQHAQDGNSFSRVTVGGDGVCRDFTHLESPAVES